MSFDPVMVGCHVVIVRGAGLRSWWLLSECQSSSTVIYSSSDAKNKQNKVKRVLGFRKMSDFCVCFSQEHSLCANIVCVCENDCLLKNHHLLWLIRPRHGNHEWLQMLKGQFFFYVIFFLHTFLSTLCRPFLSLTRAYGSQTLDDMSFSV